MKVKAKAAMWEDLSESYGLKYLQAYSPSGHRHDSEDQPCLQTVNFSFPHLDAHPQAHKGWKNSKTNSKSQSMDDYINAAKLID